MHDVSDRVCCREGRFAWVAVGTSKSSLPVEVQHRSDWLWIFKTLFDCGLVISSCTSWSSGKDCRSDGLHPISVDASRICQLVQAAAFMGTGKNFYSQGLHGWMVILTWQASFEHCHRRACPVTKRASSMHENSWEIVSHKNDKLRRSVQDIVQFESVVS